MHRLRPLAILLAIFTLPAVLAWGFVTLVWVFLFVPHSAGRWLANVLPAAALLGIVLMGWISLASLFWTARHFSAYISPTPRWVLAGYLFGALLFALTLAELVRALPAPRDAQSMLGYFGGPACLLLLALWRLWRIRRFYAIDIADSHQDKPWCDGPGGTFDEPTDHHANPCSSDPPASSR